MMFWHKATVSSSQQHDDEHKTKFSFENIPKNDNSNITRPEESKEGSATTESSSSVPQQPTTSTSNSQINNRGLSMKFVRCISGLVCQECGTDPVGSLPPSTTEASEPNSPSSLTNLLALHRSSSISPLVLKPMTMGHSSPESFPSGVGRQIEEIMSEYMALCQFYKVPFNAGVLATLRFSLPCLRVTGSFHDMDMLALTELLLHHANTRLCFIVRLDFGIASKEGKQFRNTKRGFTSHGALALAKALQTTKYIQQVWLPRHRIGPYGASAIFLACQENPTIQSLNMRRCRIGERGAFAFCESLASTGRGGLIDVDLSSNGIGHLGTVAIERILERQGTNGPPLFVNLEGNLVLPEIMNAITHGLGILLSIYGGFLLSDRVKGISHTHMISCAIYTASLLVLYVSSTLFHSFFTLRNTKYVFLVFDKCAIYVLIAGTYTPLMQIALGDQPIFSVGLLGFIWACGFLGIGIESFCPTWKHRNTFTLLLTIAMGWAAVACLPAFHARLAKGCINLLWLGGIGYTAGVPFFVRDNNMDHAIWHLFVLMGSLFHWLAIYIYVAPLPLSCASAASS